MGDEFNDILQNVTNKGNFLGEGLTSPSSDPLDSTDFIYLALEAGESTSNLTYTDFQAYLDGFNSSNKLPKTWDSFITNYRATLNQDPLLDPETNNPITSPTDGTLFQRLVNEFSAINGLGTSYFSTGPIDITDEELGNQFREAFSQFLQTYDYDGSGNVGTAAEFFTQWYNFIAYTSKVNDTEFNNGIYFYAPDGAPNGLTYVTNELVTNYQQIYDTYTASLTSAPTFDELLEEFYYQQVANKGFFTPSRGLSDWTNVLEEVFNDAQQRASKIILLNTEDNYLASNVTITDGVYVYNSNIEIEGVELGDIYTFSVQSGIQMDVLNSSTASFTTSQTIPINGPATLSITITDPGTTVPATLRIFMEEFGTATTDSWNNTVSSLRYENDEITPQNAKTINISTFTDDGFLEESVTTSSNEIVNILQNDLSILHVHTSVTTDQTKRVLVLTRIFKLLANLIGTLQLVAAAQAEQIQFLTAWQRAFTDVITQVRTFARADGTVFGLTNSSNATADQELAGTRADINQDALNKREQLSAWRGIVSDTAKREQTRLNQSNDAVSQQANMATSIIQQLSTILGAIFR